VIEVVRNLACLAGGVAIGYFVAHTRLEKIFRERLYKEVDDSKEFFRLKYEKKVEDDEKLKEANEALKSYAVTSTDSEATPDEEHEEFTPVAPSVPIVPEQAVGKVDYHRISTKAKENPDDTKVRFNVVPIDKKEFDENDLGFEQSEMTYFAGDDILSNVRDEAITQEARDEILGTEIFDLLKSPEARGGSNEVYARNVPRKREFLIYISSGNYTDEVGEVVYADG